MFITNDRRETNSSSEKNFTIDYLPKDDFECGRWWWYIFAIPLMKIMEMNTVCKAKIGELLNFKPRRTSLPFDRGSAWTRNLIEFATQWQALDDQYPYANKPFRAFLESEKTKDVLDAVWMKYMLHNMAVRNRFRVVKNLLKAGLRELYELGRKEVRVVGLASGSGRDIIEVAAEFYEQEGEGAPEIKIFLIDHSNKALAKAKELAEQHGISESVKCIRGIIKSGKPPRLITNGSAPSSEKLAQALKELHPDIVYNIGFFDYKTRETVVRMKSAIRRSLSKDGMFISGNIISNPEMEFLPRVINWARMYHRSPKEFAELMVDAGFADIEVLVEPNQIFSIGIGRVNTSP